MRIVTLVRNEWIKTTRRFAFWVGLLSFGGIMALVYGEYWNDARRRVDLEFAFPDAWTSLTDDVTFVTVIFATVILAMLVGGEYAFKTARQNVIDGLSKEQFFGGKLVQWLGVIAAFALAQLLIGGVFAAAGTPAGPTWVRNSDLGLLAGYGLAILLMTGLALLLIILSRNAAAGIGLFFLYIAFLEDILLVGIRLVHEGAARTAAPYLPQNLAEELLRSWQWDPVSLFEATREAVESGGTAPVPMDPTVLVGAGLVWVVVLVGAAFLIFRARDL